MKSQWFYTGYFYFYFRLIKLNFLLWASQTNKDYYRNSNHFVFITDGTKWKQLTLIIPAYINPEKNKKQNHRLIILFFIYVLCLFVFLFYLCRLFFLFLLWLMEDFENFWSPEERLTSSESVRKHTSEQPRNTTTNTNNNK